MHGTTILAKDMMTKKLVTLCPTMDVFEAIDVLLRKRISGAPVVDHHGCFLGIFSESSSMRVIVNAAYDGLPDAGLMAFVDTDPPTVSPDTDMLTICQTFLDQATRRLPVLKDGVLLGQVSRRDVMRKVVSLQKTRECCGQELLYLSALHVDAKTFSNHIARTA